MGCHSRSSTFFTVYPLHPLLPHQTSACRPVLFLWIFSLILFCTYLLDPLPVVSNINLDFLTLAPNQGLPLMCLFLILPIPFFQFGITEGWSLSQLSWDQMCHTLWTDYTWRQNHHLSHSINPTRMPWDCWCKVHAGGERTCKVGTGRPQPGSSFRLRIFSCEC